MRAVSAREMSGKIGGLLREHSPGATSSEEPRCDQQSVTEKCAANGARHGPANAAATIERIVRNLSEWTGHGRGSDHRWRTDVRDFRRRLRHFGLQARIEFQPTSDE